MCKYLALWMVQACYGHTEGAAGLAGVLTAAAACCTALAPPVTSLRSLNPFVAAATAEWRARHGMPALLPRQTLPSSAEARCLPETLPSDI